MNTGMVAGMALSFMNFLFMFTGRQTGYVRSVPER